MSTTAVFRNENAQRCQESCHNRYPNPNFRQNNEQNDRVEHTIPLENDYTYDIAIVSMMFEKTLIGKTKDHDYGTNRSHYSKKELNEQREEEDKETRTTNHRNQS